MLCTGPTATIAAETAGAAPPTAPDRPRNHPARTGSISGRIQNVATGQFLNNARVALRGTDIVTFTDQSGTYRLSNVPSGPVVLDVFYTGLDARQVSFELPADAHIVQNIELINVARYGGEGAVVKLDPFVLSASRETNAIAIATNGQRFAPNIKLVAARELPF